MEDERFLSYGHPIMQRDETPLQFYKRRRGELSPDDGNRWYLFIKELRVEHDCSLDEAHAIALADPIWRRWLERQINGNPQCRKSALWHMWYHSDAALIEQVQDRLQVRG